MRNVIDNVGRRAGGYLATAAVLQRTLGPNGGRSALGSVSAKMESVYGVNVSFLATVDFFVWPIWRPRGYRLHRRCDGHCNAE